MKRGRPRHDDVLTPREWEVLALIREGLTNEQIAGRLEISSNTAKFHVAEILSKLGVSRREEAARLRVLLPPWARQRASISEPATFFTAAGLVIAILIGLIVTFAVVGFPIRFSDSRTDRDTRPALLVPTGIDAAPLSPADFRMTVCIDNDSWQKPTLEQQREHIESDRRYSPWDESLRVTFEAAFHVGAWPATGRPNPLGKLVLFSGLWTYGDGKQLYAALEAGCPNEPNAVTHPDLLDLWLIGHVASTAVLDHGRVVIVVAARPAGFQAVQLRFPGPAADYAGPIDFVDASGTLLARIE